MREKDKDELKQLVSSIVKQLQELDGCILTGSRRILGRTGRDWDFALLKVPQSFESLPWHIKRPSPGKHQVKFGIRFADYFDVTVKEVWSLDLGLGYEHKIDLQICRDEWMWAEKADVTEFLTSKENTDIELVVDCFGWAPIWRELLFPPDYDPNPIWDKMLRGATEEFHNVN